MINHAVGSNFARLGEKTTLRYAPKHGSIHDLHMQGVNAIRQLAHIQFDMPRAVAEIRRQSLPIVLVKPIAASEWRLRSQPNAQQHQAAQDEYAAFHGLVFWGYSSVEISSIFTLNLPSWSDLLATL